MSRENGLVRGLYLALVLSLVVSPGSSEEMSPARRFVLRPHQHGIYLDEVRNLGKEALPELAAILREDSSRQYWAYAAVTMALIGEPAALDTLEDFVWKRFHGPIDETEFQAMGSWQSAIATGGARGDRRVVEALMRGTDPAHWDSLPWSYTKRDTRWRNEFLARVCTNALGRLPGAVVRHILMGLQERPHFELQRKDATSALKANAEVTRIGIEEYLRQQSERAHRGRIQR